VVEVAVVEVEAVGSVDLDVVSDADSGAESVVVVAPVDDSEHEARTIAAKPNSDQRAAIALIQGETLREWTEFHHPRGRIKQSAHSRPLPSTKRSKSPALHPAVPGRERFLTRGRLCLLDAQIVYPGVPIIIELEDDYLRPVMYRSDRFLMLAAAVVLTWLVAACSGIEPTAATSAPASPERPSEPTGRTVDSLTTTVHPASEEFTESESDGENCVSSEPAALADVPEGWFQLTPPPAARARAAVVWTGEYLLLIGGDTGLGGVVHDDVFSYDPELDIWSCVEPLPFAARDPRGVWTGTEVYVVAGPNTAVLAGQDNQWRQLPEPPHTKDLGLGRPGCCPPVAAVWTGDHPLIWGNTSRHLEVKDGSLYDPSSENWRTTSPAPMAINVGGGVWTGEELVVFGAHQDENNLSATHTPVGAAYTPETDSWRVLAEIPFGMAPQWIDIAWDGSRAVVVDHRHAAAAYDPATDTWHLLHHAPMESFGGVTLTEMNHGAVFAWDGYAAAILDPGTDTWLKIPTPATSIDPFRDGLDGVYGRPVSTGREVFFAGAAHEGHGNGLWKYSPED
jgi:hypothetical protein